VSHSTLDLQSLIVDGIQRALDRIEVLPRRVLLETPAVAASVPMLRGVWGAALRGLDPAVYRRVFEGRAAPGAAGVQTDTPQYILRPAPPDPQFAPAMEWILIGDAIRADETLRQAWFIASGMGLGADRRRFQLRQWLRLDAAGRAAEDGRPWPLGQAAWPWPEPETAPCRLRFDAPLRLRRKGRLIEQPTLADIAVAATRRVATFLPAEDRAAWQPFAERLHGFARRTPQGPWQGDRLDLARYSGRQQRELELHGISGSLPLPAGPGPLWPLLAAAAWLHIGKGTVMGLGQLRIEAAGRN